MKGLIEREEGKVPLAVVAVKVVLDLRHSKKCFFTLSIEEYFMWLSTLNYHLNIAFSLFLAKNRFLRIQENWIELMEESELIVNPFIAKACHRTMLRVASDFCLSHAGWKGPNLRHWKSVSIHWRLIANYELKPGVIFLVKASNFSFEASKKCQKITLQTIG